MCIFNHDVKEVKNTKIFVGATANGKQLTVYANEVQNAKKGDKNAMILPFPVPAAKQTNYDEAKSHLVEYNKDIVTLIDLSKYSNFFEDLDEPFVVRSKSLNSMGRGMWSAPVALEVVEVGGYQCSVARTMKDLQRIDEKVFKVSPRIVELLQKEYASGYGFVICVFTKDVDSAHPIAYEHLLADGTGGGKKGSLFVPCKHDHGDGKTSAKAYFDHWIYGLNCKQPFPKVTPHVSTETPLKESLIPVKLEAQKALCKSVVVGNYANTDYNFEMLV